MEPQTVLLINKFLYPKGGDAVSTFQTGKILESKGLEMVYWRMDHPNNPKYPYQDYFISNQDYNSRGDIRIGDESNNQIYSCQYL